MQDLQLIGVHEDGEHLLLSGPGDERFLVRVDEALRAAIRRDRPRPGQQQTEGDIVLRPRDVQALIRAGVSPEETASRAAWSVEKVHRFEGPILAEREYVAGLGQQARLRAHTGGAGGGGAATLSARVAERLASRDVEMADVGWDSRRAEGGPWTVVLTFAAGGRQRQASWSFDLADRTVSAIDDEARWLSEQVQEAEGPIPAPNRPPTSGRDTMVYDVEAEGGLRPAPRDEHQDDPLDLMTAMRRRSTARGRRRPGGRGASGGSSASGGSPTGAAKSGDTGDTGRHGTDSHDAEQHDQEQTLPLTEMAKDEPAAPLMGLAGGDVGTDSGAPHDTAPLEPTSHDTGDDDAGEARGRAARQGRPKAGPRRPGQGADRKTGRPSVPAWDEIMFGSRPGADRSSS